MMVGWADSRSRRTLGCVWRPTSLLIEVESNFFVCFVYFVVRSFTVSETRLSTQAPEGIVVGWRPRRWLGYPRRCGQQARRGVRPWRLCIRRSRRGFATHAGNERGDKAADPGREQRKQAMSDDQEGILVDRCRAFL
jgi:hypothetical protein